MLILLLLIGMLGIMLLRVQLPVARAKPLGRTIQTIYLSFPERLIMQRINMYAIAAFLLLLAVTGQLPAVFAFLALAVAQVILMLPVRCVLTSEGVAINNVVFRPWPDFTSFSVDRRRIWLTAQPGLRGMALPMLPANQERALSVLRRHLKQDEAQHKGFSLASLPRPSWMPWAAERGS